MSEHADIIDKAIAEMGIAPGTRRRLTYLVRKTTAARGLDLWAVEELGYSGQQWAEETGRSPSTVQRNIRRAREELDDDA